MEKKDIEEIKRIDPLNYKGFKIIPSFSDYGDVTTMQMLRRFFLHINKYFGEVNEAINEFILLYEDLSKIMEEHEAFMQAWAEMIESNENFVITVTEMLENWIHDPRLEELINDVLLSGKLDSGIFNDFINGDFKDLKDIIASKFVSVKEYGAKGDGVTDDTQAIQDCINANDYVYFPKGDYITTLPLYMNRSGIVIEGNSVHNTRIIKTTNTKLTGSGIDPNLGINYDFYDAIIMTIGYYGDFSIRDIRFESKAPLKVAYGLLFARSYRFKLEDLYIDRCDESIRLFQGWNNNIKKVRMRHATYGIRVESETNTLQSTSITFDNTFVESSSFGYKFVNLTYFSGVSMSTDFITECAYWFHFSSGGINGMGVEKSPGQLIRNWLSNVTVNGGFMLGMQNKMGYAMYAKSKAKFEVWTENRNQTGLIINGFEIRNFETSTGDATTYYVGGNASLSLHNVRDADMKNVLGNTDEISAGSSLYITDQYASDNVMRRFLVNKVDVQPLIMGYNKNENVASVDGFFIFRTQNTMINSVTIPLSEIRKRYPFFGQSDNFIAGRYSLSIFSSTNGTSDIYLNGRNFVTNYKKDFGDALTFESVTYTGEDVTFKFNRPANYVTIKIKEI